VRVVFLPERKGGKNRLDGRALMELCAFLRRTTLIESEEMDLPNILKQLREQRDQLDVSILALERIEAGKARGPGRPPKWLTEAKTAAPKRRGRPPGRKPAQSDGE
jgi:hypothetical protein